MKAAIYCRLSEEDKNKLDQSDDSGSIQNQKAILIQYANEHHWTIYDVYSDDNYTGSDRSRPAFCRLIQDARARHFEIILCKSQSRFTRELELVETYIHGLFPQLGIRFISIVDNADTDNKGNKKARQINGLVNEWFLEELSENIKAVLTNRRENGYHIGSFAPYGYQKDPLQKGHLLVDPEAAKIVEEIFQLYADGFGKQRIARQLNERGIPNPTEYKRLHGLERNRKKRGSGLWSYFTISDMLVNQVYIGNLVQGKTQVVSYKTQEKAAVPKDHWIIAEHTHEPIINSLLWNQVQALIQQKTAAASVSQEGTYARKVRCIYCGSHLHSVKSGNKRGFQCRQHTLSHDACIGAYISLPKLERTVAAQLRILSDDLLDFSRLEAHIHLSPELLETQSRIQTECLSYTHRLERCNATLRKLYLDKVKGLITDTAYQKYSFDIQNQKDQLSMQIADCQQQLVDLESTLTRKHSREELEANYTGRRQLTKEMADAFVDHILVGRRNPITKATPIEIHWNF